ncbi:MAG: type II toxin-antitoxin system VapC family toxin [Euryarchaeota archaeon]|nr:type II toxin-antitoxin system VapC family toxin [Euryarchaeota archaeon]
MYLLDTNILLELLLGREKAEDADRFLQSVPASELHISEFSLYSLGIFLSQRRMAETFLDMVDDLIIRGRITVIRLLPEDMRNLIAACDRYGLDFDDAYQYVMAERYGLTLVSLDAHFDKTERGRRTPGDLIARSR